MDILRTCLQWFRITSTPRPVALKHSPLGKLPNEIIQSIAEQLPQLEAATFSLTSTQVLEILGDKYLNPQRQSVNWRNDLLELLERDSSDLVMCYQCCKLHSIRKARARLGFWNIESWVWALGYRQQYWQKSILPCWSLARHDYEGHANFNVALARMTMKLFRQGNDYQKFLRCLSYQGRMTALDSYSGIELKSAEARVVDGSLFIRKQIIFVCSLDRISERYFHFQGSPCLVQHDFEDTHDYTYAGTFMPALHIKQFRVWNEIKGKPWQVLEMRNHCRNCKTEMRIDFERMGEGAMACFMTVWQESDDDMRHPQHQENDEDKLISKSFSEVKQWFEESGPYTRFQLGETFIASSLWTGKDRIAMRKALNELRQTQAQETQEGPHGNSYKNEKNYSTVFIRFPK